MDFKPISFKGFRGRSKLLGEIKRYSLYPTMFFRPSVDFHTKRMEWIAEELIPYLKDINLDHEKLRVLCRIHDDPEIITGDHQLGRKLYTMKKEELDALDREEDKARVILANVWPKMLHGYNYYGLLREAKDKKTPEAQVMKLIDRLDAFGESLHEIYSGNSCFLKHPTIPEIINPVQTYIRVIGESLQKYPILLSLFDNRHPMLSLPKEIDQERIVSERQLPTPATIRQKTQNPHYDAWIDITLRRAGKSGINLLTNKLE